VLSQPCPLLYKAIENPEDPKDDVQNELFKLRDVFVYDALVLLPANIE